MKMIKMAEMKNAKAYALSVRDDTSFRVNEEDQQQQAAKITLILPSGFNYIPMATGDISVGNNGVVTVDGDGTLEFRQNL